MKAASKREHEHCGQRGWKSSSLRFRLQEANHTGNTKIICTDPGQAAAELAARGLKPNAVVVDPPRKGMSEEAVAAVAAMSPERVVYVSCNPATLARDILRFNSYGYTLEKVTAVDMFPRTCHVETVVLLSHKYEI